jgi:hypothetical protein
MSFFYTFCGKYELNRVRNQKPKSVKDKFQVDDKLEIQETKLNEFHKIQLTEILVKFLLDLSRA